MSTGAFSKGNETVSFRFSRASLDAPPPHPGARKMALRIQKWDNSGQGFPQGFGRQQGRASAWAPDEGEQSSAATDELRARAPVPREVPPPDRQVVEKPADEENQPPDQRGNEPRRGLLRRHPFACVLGLVLFGLLAAGGYLYWDHAGHFQS